MYYRCSACVTFDHFPRSLIPINYSSATCQITFWATFAFPAGTQSANIQFWMITDLSMPSTRIILAKKGSLSIGFRHAIFNSRNQSLPLNLGANENLAHLTLTHTPRFLKLSRRLLFYQSFLNDHGYMSKADYVNSRPI